MRKRRIFFDDSVEKIRTITVRRKQIKVQAGDPRIDIVNHDRHHFRVAVAGIAALTGFWYVPSFAVGRYTLELTTDTGRRYRGTFSIRDLGPSHVPIKIAVSPLR